VREVTALLLATLLAAEPDAMIGKVRIDGPSISKSVSLETESGGVVKLGGDPVGEIEKLASAKIEIIGEKRDDAFVVQSYRILDIGGGAQPLVGELVQVGDNALGLKDGSGDPIPLSMPAKSKSKLTPKVGAKIWVHGNKLVSGELKVLRYGILKEPLQKEN
jgi:hypothetical protein